MQWNGQSEDRREYQSLEKQKSAKAKVYKEYIKTFAEHSLAQETSASKWIDEYKNSKYNTFYKK